MPLLGKAAMLLSFDIAPEAIPEHDDWHTHEHLPERLSIPGFIRGTRWTVIRGQPRYVVMYEVAQVETLTSEPYLQRLNNPTPWTAKMMPHYRNMRRGFCSVTGSFGFGIGHVGLLVRFKPGAEAAAATRDRLIQEVLPKLPANPGIGSAHLLEGAATPPMTKEQSIRGRDGGVDWAVFVTGYTEDAVAGLSHTELGRERLEAQGATGVLDALYRIDYSLSYVEMNP